MKTYTRAMAVGLGAVLCLTSLAAGAVSVSPNQTISPGFYDTTWYMTGNAGTSGGPFGGVCNNSAGIGISDAEGPTGAGDAFDIAFNVYINGAPFTVADSVDLSWNTYTAGPTMMSGLSTTVQYYFVPSSAVARIYVSMQNPGESAITARVQVPVNWGSDGSSTIVTTSSGDALLTLADRWLISRDATTSDPVNLGVFYGPGAAVIPSYTKRVFGCSGTEGVGATYTITIPAGDTRALMMFAGLGGIEFNNNMVSSASASALFFNYTGIFDPDWMSGLYGYQRDRIANWLFNDDYTTCVAEGFTGDTLKLCQLACEVPGHEQVIDKYLRLWALKVGGVPPCLIDDDQCEYEGGGEGECGGDNNQPSAVIAPVSPTMPETVRNGRQPTTRTN